MTTYSKVRIQGGKTPGVMMEVTVPTSWSYSEEVAKTQYYFEGASYIWQNSWDDDDNKSSSSVTSSSSSGDICGAVFSLIGWTAVTTWVVTKWAAPKVWKGCELAVDGVEWVLANTR